MLDGGGMVKVEKADAEPLDVGDGNPRPGTLRCVMMALAGGFFCFCDGRGVPLQGLGAAMALWAVSLEKRTVRRGAASQH